jgi:4-hydroxy-tetrahydrodipicolinate reductase
VARLVAERPGLELVGGIDIDPDKVGVDVGEVIGLGRSLGFCVAAGLSEPLAQREADLAVHTTSSCFDLFKGQIAEILEAGLDVVSTAEELSFPWLSHSEEAAELDAVAKKVGKTVLGTGVNPGFIMDSLPLYLTAICQQVDRIEVTRVVNASLRRGSFQAKIGCGMTAADFKAKMAAGRMGHVGLSESIGMLFDTLGRQLARYETSVEPVLADRLVSTRFLSVEPGKVRGLKQVARGYTGNGGAFATLAFIAALDAGDDGDTIRISGKPDLEVKLKGTNGDLATVAIVVNAIQRVREADAGLVTMRDLPIVTSWWASRTAEASQ